MLLPSLKYTGCFARCASNFDIVIFDELGDRLFLCENFSQSLITWELFNIKIVLTMQVKEITSFSCP